ncbi:hypothetical protein [Paenibacillus contaminans]|uniref:TM2 domain-containing protein n=1 Tax=Paenibacillus contaminans TaxID=450362 RepID=A0A329MCA3_9BACL|nr:hypothetical protein [Paenibacillus contaminans]RAV17651.1 hypothetical protein DQG23_26325 [Paenibacillus contaminans]
MEGNQNFQNDNKRQDDFFEERMRQFQTPPFPNVPFSAPPRKSKALTGLFSFLFPGIGHFYLGLMQKGLVVMLLFILNIAAIPTVVISMEGDNFIPLVVLISCLLPVVYFYNIFDALQLADKVNARARMIQTGELPPEAWGTDPLGGADRPNRIGLVLIGAGIVFFLLFNRPAWFNELFHMNGSYIGAAILIGAGIVLFVMESRKK